VRANFLAVRGFECSVRTLKPSVRSQKPPVRINKSMLAVRKNLDLVWVWFYKDAAPTALNG
jgi:hypothetical protein